MGAKLRIICDLTIYNLLFIHYLVILQLNFHHLFTFAGVGVEHSLLILYLFFF